MSYKLEYSSEESVFVVTKIIYGDLEGMRHVFIFQEDFIKWLFFNRCVGLDNPCMDIATEINEIIPKSSGKEKAMHWKNRVTMCSKHHREYHDRGTSKENIEKLQERRKEFLKNMYREEFI